MNNKAVSDMPEIPTYQQEDFLNDAAGEAFRLNPNYEKYLNKE